MQNRSVSRKRRPPSSFILHPSSFILILLWCSFTLYPFDASGASSTDKPRLGIWITVFSPEKVLYSEENADRLIRICKRSGITDIYMQVYRADKAYYNSAITDNSPYRNIIEASGGEDVLAYLIRTAHKNNIKIYAWLNMLSLAQNKNANILKKIGIDILTRDQHGRPSMPEDKKDALDKYYIRENQIFLEPGESLVRKYLTDIVTEVLLKYPGFSGIHLDYIRYPSVVPFIPGSRFSSHGISYGYSRSNIDGFKKKTGLNLRTMSYSRENYKLWDDWKRAQVTALVMDISKSVRNISPSAEISCTIVPSIERTYLTTYQDWTKWLRKKYIDYVVAMNYTDDTKLMRMNASSLLLPGLEKKVQIGLGIYLFKDNYRIIEEQLKSLRRTSPAGVVMFSYDEIAGNEKLQELLRRLFI